MPNVNGVSGTNGPQLPPAIDVTPNAGLATPGSILPDPIASLEASGDPAAMLATLLVKAGQEAKRGDRAAQAAEEKAQEDAENAEIDAMRTKASDLRAQGIESGLTSVATGALTVGAGECFGTKQAKILEGAAKMGDGVGHFLDGQAKADIADDETSARLHEQVANRAKRAVDEAHDGIKDDADLIKTAIDFYREYTGGQSQARSAALHRS